MKSHRVSGYISLKSVTMLISQYAMDVIRKKHSEQYCLHLCQQMKYFTKYKTRNASALNTDFKEASKLGWFMFFPPSQSSMGPSFVESSSQWRLEGIIQRHWPP
jgi:hypothetical protein